MKKYHHVVLSISLILLVISAFAIARLIAVNRSLRQSLPYLLKNETINYFELIGENGNQINHEAINRPTFIFIFSRPCSPCDKNISLWNTFAELFQEKMDIFGIVLEEPEAIGYLREKVKLNFPLYSPRDINKFIPAFRLRLPHSQTIIINGKVTFQKTGELTQNDFSRIVEQCEKF